MPVLARNARVVHLARDDLKRFSVEHEMALLDGKPFRRGRRRMREGARSDQHAEQQTGLYASAQFHRTGSGVSSSVTTSNGASVSVAAWPASNVAGSLPPQTGFAA